MLVIFDVDFDDVADDDDDIEFSPEQARSQRRPGTVAGGRTELYSDLILNGF